MLQKTMLTVCCNTKKYAPDLATIQRNWHKKKNQIGKIGGERKKKIQEQTLYHPYLA